MITAEGILAVGSATKVAGELEQTASAAEKTASTRNIIASDGTTVIVLVGRKPRTSAAKAASYTSIKKENPRMRLNTVGVWFVVGLLASCAGTPDPAKVAAQQHEGSAQIFANQKKKGSLLLVRMVDSPLLGDVDCDGYITLRRINAGKPDETEPPLSVGSAPSYRLQNPNKLSLGQLFSATAQKYERWFVPVAPGRYAITYASCHYGNTTIEAGGDNDGLFGRTFSYVQPFGGESTITIGQGQIVDAGYIRLAGTRSDPRVVGSEATPAERDLMKSVMPDVYPSITFTKFGL